MKSRMGRTLAALLSVPVAFLLLWLVPKLDPTNESIVHVTAKLQSALVSGYYSVAERDNTVVMLIDDESVGSEGWPISYGKHARWLRNIGDKYRPEAIFIDVVFSSTRKDETIGQLASALCELRDKGVRVYLAGLMDKETRRVRVRPELEGECEKGRIETVYINYQPHHVDRLVWDYDLHAAQGAHAQSGSHGAPHGAAGHTASNDIRTPALAIAQDIFHSRVPKDHEAMALTWGINNLALPRYADWCRQTAGGLSELVPPRLRWWDSDALLPVCPYSRSLSMRDLFVSCSEAAGCEADRKKLHDQLDGRVVMIGAYLRGFKDTVATPLHGDIPGVFLHAMALDNLLTKGGKYNRAYEWEMPLKLPLFHGHLTVMEEGVRDGQDQAAVSGGVSRTDH